MTPTAPIVTGLAVIAGFCCGTAIAGCNNANIKGAYGHLANASLPTDGGEAGPVSSTPLVTVGLLTFDGKGGITGSASGVKAGVTTPVTVTGSYSVGDDCTLTINADLFVQPQQLSTIAAAAAALVGNRIDSITLQGVVVQHGTRINAIVTSSMSGVQTGSGVFDSVQ
jgi:hypothetical protein